MGILLSCFRFSLYRDEPPRIEGFTFPIMNNFSPKCEQLFENLETREVSSVVEEEGEVCPTCFYEYIDENPKIVLQCGHIFHLACIYEWMERSQACPFCAKTMLFLEGEISQPVELR